MKKIFSLLLIFLALHVSGAEKDNVFLFSYFTGNGEDGLHLAYSRDGLNFSAIGNNKSFLSPSVGVSKLMRDPCIIQTDDGVFHMVWTAGWTERGIGYASSRDLINWSEQKYIMVMDKEPTARNCWAPEIVYDNKDKQFLIFWSTTIPGRFPESEKEGDTGYNHRIYSTTTKDFTTYTDTRLFYDKGFNVIDATIIQDKKKFVMYVKDETRTPPEKNIRVTTSSSLYGPYSASSEPITGKYWAEGPTPVKIGKKFYVYFDKYTEKKMGAVVSEDLLTWEDISDKLSFPEGMRHGTIFTANEAILENLLNAAKEPEIKQNTVQKANSIYYNVKDFGAMGDSIAFDTDAINKTIEKASQAGGGTVYFPAGQYLSFSIHLKSNITLLLDNGAVLIAADPNQEKGGYDAPEPNPWGDLRYQDFGHSHWQNSLIWGENLENIAIIGHGMINGKGLTRSGNSRAGIANKAIALKLCRNVILKDISILTGGHFCLLATGVDNMTIDNMKLDTNRDGFDIDCCRHVHISNCSVNAPFDDAIVLKSSFALGFARPTEDVTITNCFVSGFDIGTFLDGTYKRENAGKVPDRGVVTGRIKLGTESNGGFRNITISNCTFEFCRGLALETVDGGILEDITITNITMRDVMGSPFFLRTGSRMRGPEGVPVGILRRVNISNIIAYSANPDYASLLMGIPGYDIEDVRMDNITILVKGGASKEQAALTVPEKENAYPDPQEFIKIPAYGFFIRHARNISMSNIELKLENDDMRPAFILEDVKGATFQNIKTTITEGVPSFVLKDVSDFKTINCNSIPDKKILKTSSLKL